MKHNHLIAAALAALLSVPVYAQSSNDSEDSSDEPFGLRTDLDSVSYALGMVQGIQMANVQDPGTVIPGETVSLNHFMAGLTTAIYREPTLMSNEEVETLLTNYFEAVKRRVEANDAPLVNENKRRGKEYRDKFAKEEGVTKLPSGLLVKTITAGTGKAPSKNSTVKVQYKGTYIDGTVFDDNKGIEFKLDEVVKGFQEGICQMKEGGKAIVVMPSDLAYGDSGVGPIPGGSTLVFEIELIKVK